MSVVSHLKKVSSLGQKRVRGETKRKNLKKEITRHTSLNEHMAKKKLKDIHKILYAFY